MMPGFVCNKNDSPYPLEFLFFATKMYVKLFASAVEVTQRLKYYLINQKKNICMNMTIRIIVQKKTVYDPW